MKRLFSLFFIACAVLAFIWWDKTYELLPETSVLRALTGEQVVKRVAPTQLLENTTQLELKIKDKTYQILHENSKWLWIAAKGEKKQLKQELVERFLTGLLSAKALRILNEEKEGYGFKTGDEIKIYLRGKRSPWLIKVGVEVPGSFLRYVKIGDKILLLSSMYFYELQRIEKWQEASHGRGKSARDTDSGKGSSVEAHPSPDGGR